MRGWGYSNRQKRVKASDPSAHGSVPTFIDLGIYDNSLSFLSLIHI